VYMEFRRYEFRRIFFTSILPNFRRNWHRITWIPWNSEKKSFMEFRSLLKNSAVIHVQNFEFLYFSGMVYVWLSNFT
jgi:hypothetical protein